MKALSAAVGPLEWWTSLDLREQLSRKCAGESRTGQRRKERATKGLLAHVIWLVMEIGEQRRMAASESHGC